MSIQLDPSPEQAQIVDAVRKLLASRFAVSRLRGPHPGSPDAERLPDLLALGVVGLGAPEALGGMGLGIMQDMLVHVELGRHLVSPRVLAGVLGARLAAALGHAQLARAFITGEQAVCLASALRRFDFESLGGQPVHLLDVQGAAWALLWNDAGIGLLRLAGLDAVRVAATDRAVPLQRATLKQAALHGHLPSAATPLLRQAHLLVSAQLLGMAEATRDMAVAYAQLRAQFGRPIGAFQAIKHRCADMAVRAAVLRAQLVLATLAQQQGWADAPFQVDACRLLAAPHALANARANIQVHGGMGFTAECDAHLYLLRAHLYEHLGGSTAATEQRLLSQRFLDEPRGAGPCA